jgi:SnoaL-like domain
MFFDTTDRIAIRDLLENWVIWRDAGIWDRFRTLWHDDGVMMATWFQGGPDEFITNSKASFARGIRAQHFLGGSSIDIAGYRAVAQTKMTILHRAPIEYVMCDFTVVGRFYDLLEKREGRWGLVLRQPIYEKDRIDPVVPGTTPKLDRTLLEQFPEGYRHMAYMQTKAGYSVKADMPGATGPELDALYAKGEAWLKNKSDTILKAKSS